MWNTYFKKCQKKSVSINQFCPPLSTFTMGKSGHNGRHGRQGRHGHVGHYGHHGHWDRQVREDRQIWHLDLIFQVTCVGLLLQFLRCFVILLFPLISGLFLEWQEHRRWLRPRRSRNKKYSVGSYVFFLKLDLIFFVFIELRSYHCQRFRIQARLLFSFACQSIRLEALILIYVSLRLMTDVVLLSWSL